jgi:hypothetical protein
VVGEAGFHHLAKTLYNDCAMQVYSGHGGKASHTLNIGTRLLGLNLMLQLLYFWGKSSKYSKTWLIRNSAGQKKVFWIMKNLCNSELF